VRNETPVGNMIRLLALSLAIVLTTICEIDARDIYVDPSRQGLVGDGSSANPWQSLGQALKDETLEPGDTIFLRSGDYGDVRIKNRRNEAAITIAAEKGHVPRFANIRIIASSNWHLRGLSVSPSYAPSSLRGSIIRIDKSSEDITVEDCKIMSFPDSSSWMAADWRALAPHGITAGGTRITLRGNTLKNVDHGINVGASHSLVENNLVENFSGDGMRGLGDYTTFRSNTVKNCYKVDGNHDDGFQSWSVGADGRVGTGEVIGVVLSGNRFINNEDPDQPMRCTMQGIGLFDGTYVDWLIENNVIVTDHWHGITVMGGRNVRIVNNTLIDATPGKPGPPWITITSHKLGHPSRDSFIVNNLAPTFDPKNFRRGKYSYNRPGVTARNNIRIVDPAAYFKDPANGDLRLKPGSRPVDAGTSRMAPATDIEGNPRPRGKAVDVGAYELQ